MSDEFLIFYSLMYAVATMVFILMLRYVFHGKSLAYIVPLFMISLTVLIFLWLEFDYDATEEIKEGVSKGEYLAEALSNSFLIIWSAILGATIVSKRNHERRGGLSYYDLVFHGASRSVKNILDKHYHVSYKTSGEQDFQRDAALKEGENKSNMFCDYGCLACVGFLCFYSMLLVFFLFLPLHVNSLIYFLCLCAPLLSCFFLEFLLDPTRNSRLHDVWRSSSNGRALNKKMESLESAVVQEIRMLPVKERKAASSEIQEGAERMREIYYFLKLVFLGIFLFAIAVELAGAFTDKELPVLWGEFLVVLGGMLPFLLVFLDRYQKFKALHFSVETSLHLDG